MLEDVTVAATGTVLKMKGKAEPILRLETLHLSEGRLDLLEQQATFGILAIGPGHVLVKADRRGSSN